VRSAVIARRSPKATDEAISDVRVETASSSPAMQGRPRSDKEITVTLKIKNFKL